jgi:mannose-6-phosphate isomerase-like protein (cupin superfamily)
MMVAETWDPNAHFEEVRHMGEGVMLENAEMERLGDGFAPFAMSRFRIAPGIATCEDTHASRELWIILSGKGDLTYDGVTSTVKKGCAYFFEENRPHSIRNTGADDLHVYSVWWSK